MQVFNQEIYTQYLSKVVYVEFANNIIQVEFHVLFEEYFDFLVQSITANYNDYLINFSQVKNATKYNSKLWNKNLLIKNIHNEKNPQDSMLMGDSWFNIVIDAIKIDDVENVNPDNLDFSSIAFENQLSKFDQVFNFNKSNEFTIESNSNEINLLLSQTIKQIITINDITFDINKKIKSITIKE